VESVSVRRIWPDRLDLTVRERQPLAFWGDRALIDDQGVIFQPSSLPISQTLPRLYGSRMQAVQMVERLERFERLLGEVGEDMAELKLDERGSWSLQTRSGIQVYLGSGQVKERLQRLVQYLPELKNQLNKQLVSVDLRYTNGFAVRHVAQTMAERQES